MAMEIMNYTSYESRNMQVSILIKWSTRIGEDACAEITNICFKRNKNIIMTKI